LGPENFHILGKFKGEIDILNIKPTFLPQKFATF